MNSRSCRLTVEALGDRTVPSTVASGDFNNDGSDDLAALTSPTTIIVSLGGAGGYTVSATLTAPKNLPIGGFSLDDYDGDGNPDILLGRRSPGAIAQLTDDYGPEFALLGFPRLKIPTASTLSKLLRRIDVAALEAVLCAWMTARLDPTQPAGDPADPLVVNMDGKCLRGSAQPSTELPGVHLLAAFAPRVRAVLAQLRVDAKTNEHKAALELLDILPRRTGGYIITGDAIFTQTEVCQAIRDRDDDYVLVVKDNQHALATDIEARLAFVATAATFFPRGPRRPEGPNARPAVGAEYEQGPRSIGTSAVGKHLGSDGASEVAGVEAGVPRAALGGA